MVKYWEIKTSSKLTTIWNSKLHLLSPSCCYMVSNAHGPFLLSPGWSPSYSLSTMIGSYRVLHLLTSCCKITLNFIFSICLGIISTTLTYFMRLFITDLFLTKIVFQVQIYQFVIKIVLILYYFLKVHFCSYMVRIKSIDPGWHHDV